MSEKKIDLSKLPQVEHGDLRVGDKIYTVHTEPEEVIKVIEIKEGSEGEGYVETVGSIYYADETVVYLLAEREYTEIPTEVGSVIRVDGVMYMLTDADGLLYKRWVKHTGGFYYPGVMQEVANKSARGFEVIA